MLEFTMRAVLDLDSPVPERSFLPAPHIGAEPGRAKGESLLSRARVQPLCGGREERRVQGLDYDLEGEQFFFCSKIRKQTTRGGCCNCDNTSASFGCLRNTSDDRRQCLRGNERRETAGVYGRPTSSQLTCNVLRRCSASRKQRYTDALVNVI